MTERKKEPELIGGLWEREIFCLIDQNISSSFLIIRNPHTIRESGGGGEYHTQKKEKKKEKNSSIIPKKRKEVTQNIKLI